MFKKYYINHKLSTYVLTEGAKDKIIKFKIDDPFLIFFLYKYENTVDWTQVQTLEQIINQIKSATKEIIGRTFKSNKDNFYMKDINLEREFQVHMNDPQIAQAWEIFRNDPDGAKDIILKAINDEKSQVFDEWIKYITKTNEIYAANPAFQFILLKPIFEDSDNQTKTSSPPLDADAVGAIYERIKQTNGKDQFNTLKAYRKLLIENQMKHGESIKGEEGWIYIPGYHSDMDRFKDNVKRVKAISTGRGWCTASGMAEPYLEQGDFYFLIENGLAVVAIRLLKSDTIAEIRGRNNDDTELRPYLERVVEFITNKKFKGGNTYIATLQEKERICKQFKEDKTFRNKVVTLMFNPVWYKVRYDDEASLSNISIEVFNENKDKIRELVKTLLEDTILLQKAPPKTLNKYDLWVDNLIGLRYALMEVFNNDVEIMNLWTEYIFQQKKIELKVCETARDDEIINLDVARVLTTFPSYFHKHVTFIDFTHSYYIQYLDSLAKYCIDLIRRHKTIDTINIEKYQQQIRAIVKRTSYNLALFSNVEELNKHKVKFIQTVMELSGDPLLLDSIPKTIQQSLNLTAEMFKHIDFTTVYKAIAKNFLIGNKLEELLQVITNIPVFASKQFFDNKDNTQFIKQAIINTFKSVYREFLMHMNKPTPQPEWQTTVWKPTGYSHQSIFSALYMLCSITPATWDKLPNEIKHDTELIKIIRQTYLHLYNPMIKNGSDTLDSLIRDARIERLCSLNEDYDLLNIVPDIPSIMMSKQLQRQIKVQSNKILNKYILLLDVNKIRALLDSSNIITLSSNNYYNFYKSSMQYMLTQKVPNSTIELRKLFTLSNVPKELKDDPAIKKQIKDSVIAMASKNPAGIKKWSLRSVLHKKDLSDIEFDNIMQNAIPLTLYKKKKINWLTILVRKFHYPYNQRRATIDYVRITNDPVARRFNILSKLKQLTRGQNMSFDVIKDDVDFINRIGLLIDGHIEYLTTYRNKYPNETAGTWLDGFFERTKTALIGRIPLAAEFYRNIPLPSLAATEIENEQPQQPQSDEVEEPDSHIRTVPEPSLAVYRAAIQAEPESEEELPEEESVNNFNSLYKIIITK